MFWCFFTFLLIFPSKSLAESDKYKSEIEEIIEKAKSPVKRKSTKNYLPQSNRGLSTREFNFLVKLWLKHKRQESSIDKKNQDEFYQSATSDEVDEVESVLGETSDLLAHGAVTYPGVELQNELKIDLSKSALSLGKDWGSYISNESIIVLPGGPNYLETNWAIQKGPNTTDSSFFPEGMYGKKLGYFSYGGTHKVLNKLKKRTESATIDVQSVISYSVDSIFAAVPYIENSMNFLKVDWEYCRIADAVYNSEADFEKSRFITDFSLRSLLRSGWDEAVKGSCQKVTRLYHLDPNDRGQKVVAPPIPNGGGFFGVSYDSKVIQLFAEHENIAGKFRVESDLASINKILPWVDSKNLNRDQLALLWQKEFKAGDSNSIVVKSWLENDFRSFKPNQGLSIELNRKVNNPNVKGDLYICQSVDNSTYTSNFGYKLRTPSNATISGEANYNDGRFNGNLNINVPTKLFIFDLTLNDENLEGVLTANQLVPGDLKIFYKHYFDLPDSIYAKYSHQILATSNIDANLAILAGTISGAETVEVEANVDYNKLPIAKIGANMKMDCLTGDSTFGLRLKLK